MLEKLQQYPIGKFRLPMLSDGGVFYPDSQVGVYKTRVIPKTVLSAGIFGSAYGEYFPDNVEKYKDTTARSRALGKELARLDVVVITGAPPGIPHHAAYGASEEGGIIIGYSPLGNETLHEQNFLSTVKKLYARNPELVNSWDLEPTKPYNIIVFFNIGHRTIERNYVQRDLPNAYSSRMIFIEDGDAGSAHETFAGLELGHRVFGILKGSGGITEGLQDFMKYIRKRNKSVIIEDEDPVVLARTAFDYVQELHERRKGIDDTLDFILMQSELAMMEIPYRGNSHGELYKELEALRI